jgi:hypothetical protein
MRIFQQPLKVINLMDPSDGATLLRRLVILKNACVGFESDNTGDWQII